MGELVSRDEAKMAIEKLHDELVRERAYEESQGAVDAMHVVLRLPAVEAVPVEWFNKMIHACGMQGEIGAVKALRWVLGAWKMTENIWEDVNVGGADQRAGEADLREVQRSAGGREGELCRVPAELQALWRGHAGDGLQGHHAL